MLGIVVSVKKILKGVVQKLSIFLKKLILPDRQSNG